MPSRIAAAIVFVVVAIGTTAIIRASGEQMIDLELYRSYGDAMESGLVPYRDFDVEYPPGALPVFLAPSLVTAEPEQYYRGVRRADGPDRSCRCRDHECVDAPAGPVATDDATRAGAAGAVAGALRRRPADAFRSLAGHGRRGGDSTVARGPAPARRCRARRRRSRSSSTHWSCCPSSQPGRGDGAAPARP